MSNIDPRTKQVLEKYCADPKKAVWNCHGKWVAYHAALEDIARNAKIRFDPPMVLEADGANKIAAICVTGHMGDASEWSIGEASDHNYKTKGKQAAYPFAMAEKRAKDRVILKLIGLHGDVYSEEEADDFKPEQKPAPKPANKPANTVTGSPKLDDLLASVKGVLESASTKSEVDEIAEDNRVVWVRDNQTDIYERHFNPLFISAYARFKAAE